MAGREGKRKLPRRQSSFKHLALLLLLPVGGLLVFLGWLFVRQALPQLRPTAKTKTSPHVRAQAVVPLHPERVRGKIVLILDDVGFDHQPLQQAMSLDPNVNFSVLPNSPHGREFAEHLHAKGFEVLCHLPMEPEGFPNISPGDGAVLTSMSDDEIVHATTTNVSSIPYARGVNNHMGSRATADKRVMRDVLSSLPRGMYFIDSRTSGSSVGFAVARSMKVPTAARNVFLDDVQNLTAVRAQIDTLRELAERRGIAIGIGHMYPVTIRALTNALPQLRRDGFKLVRASEAVR